MEKPYLFLAYRPIFRTPRIHPIQLPAHRKSFKVPVKFFHACIYKKTNLAGSS